jgi:hypothetical protein
MCLCVEAHVWWQFTITQLFETAYSVSNLKTELLVRGGLETDMSRRSFDITRPDEMMLK